MCGICGIVDLERPVDHGVVERMTAALVHRGPDDMGLWRGPHAGFGFRRLSVIDLQGSRQPLTNEDGSLQLVFNGEIYNYRELRRVLIGRGHVFRTAGDGETILHLYEDCGEDFVHQLNGMFALALWDSRRRQLILARDRLGIKPLYYHASPSRLAFASETKAFLTARSFPLTPDPMAFAEFMFYSAVPGPRTCYRQVQSLPPGNLAVFDARGLRVRPYWDIDFRRKIPRHEDELLETLDALIDDAVRSQLVSDVPLGVFLSGGVDSSLVAAFMARHSPGRVQAFVVGYGREGAYMDETPYARAVAQRYGMDVHTLIVNPGDLVRDLDRVVWHLDEPCGDPSTFLTLAISEFAVAKVKVVLSGLGGDELFAGYRRYLAAKYLKTFLRLPRSVRRKLLPALFRALPVSRSTRWLNYLRVAERFVAAADEDPKRTWMQSVCYLPAAPGPVFQGDLAVLRRESFASEALDRHWASVASLEDIVDRVMYVDSKMYLVDARLLLQDKMSMAVSLEARVPLLDHRLVEFAATVPSSDKIQGTTLKAPLKKLAERHVPRECIYREKKGFTAPLEVWLRGPLREQLMDTLTPERVRSRGVFEPNFVAWLIREFYENRRDLSIELFQVFLVETWMRLFVDGEGRTAFGTARHRHGGESSAVIEQHADRDPRA